VAGSTRQLFVIPVQGKAAIAIVIEVRLLKTAVLVVASGAIHLKTGPELADVGVSMTVRARPARTRPRLRRPPPTGELFRWQSAQRTWL